MNIRQRKSKGREKLNKCINSLQKHLEQAYNISIPIGEDDKLTK